MRLRRPGSETSSDLQDCHVCQLHKAPSVDNDKTVATATVVEGILTRCDVLFADASFLPTGEETAVLEDVLTALRVVLAVIQPELLADMRYVDALTSGSSFSASTSQGPSFTSAVGNLGRIIIRIQEADDSVDQPY